MKESWRILLKSRGAATGSLDQRSRTEKKGCGVMPRRKKEVIAEPEVKEEVKAEAPKRTRKKKAVPSVFVQSLMGGEISVEEIVARVTEVAGTSDVQIFVKSEENKAYFYVSADPGNSGFVLLWD